MICWLRFPYKYAPFDAKISHQDSPHPLSFLTGPDGVPHLHFQFWIPANAEPFLLQCSKQLSFVFWWKVFWILDPCAGDSGSPIWITKKEEDSEQNILVAVHTGGYNTAKYFQPSCSTTANRAHKITDKVLSWILTNMERYDTWLKIDKNVE